MKKVKVWLDYRVVLPSQIIADGKKAKLYEGFLGFCPIWKSKAAAKRAGHKNTKAFKRVHLETGE